ncbi:MAG: hypothetical protein ABIO80_08370 [Sphingomicrobium sp.]
MSRIVPVIIVVAFLIGGLILLSRMPNQQPTHQIEVAVPQGGNAR